MGTPLSASSVASTYQALIKTSDNSPLSSSMKRISDGLGNDIPLFISNKSLTNYGSSGVANNTAFGENALTSVGASGWCSGFGYEALKSNTGGLYNTAFGAQAAKSITVGSGNTCMGALAGELMTLSSGNTFVGALVAKDATAGDGNTVVGESAAIDFANIGDNNTILGQYAGSRGFSGSVVLGRYAASTANNQFVVGSETDAAGAITTETVSSTRTWSVIINGVARKILLA